MNKEEITKGKVQIKNKWFETREDELDIALNVIDDLLVYINQLESTLNEVRRIVSESVFKTDLVELCGMKNEIKEILNKVGGSNE